MEQIHHKNPHNVLRTVQYSAELYTAERLPCKASLIFVQRLLRFVTMVAGIQSSSQFLPRQDPFLSQELWTLSSMAVLSKMSENVLCTVISKAVGEQGIARPQHRDPGRPCTPPHYVFIIVQNFLNQMLRGLAYCHVQR